MSALRAFYQSDEPIALKVFSVIFEMVKSHDVRNIALAHYDNGIKAPEIANLLVNKVHRTTIHRCIRQDEQSGSIDVRKIG